MAEKKRYFKNTSDLTMAVAVIAVVMMLKSKVLISGEKTTQNTCSGRAMARTAFSDFAMATDFGTSSPSTTCMSVISVNAIANATV